MTSTISTTHALAEIWKRSQPQVLDRLGVLDQAANAAHRASLEPRLRADATSIAHKLAGSLGMFGFKEGTRLARRIEAVLESHTEHPAELSELTVSLRQAIFPTTP